MENPVVKLQNGQVRGSIETHEEGFTYYAFKGVPFAEPPIGKLRFKDPVPKKAWTGVLDCKEYSPIFLQYDMLRNISSTNEDALYLNVFTRTINEPNANKPVIMIIHAGAFHIFSGSDTFVGPEYLIRKDLVLVTINYRLGILGTLNVEDKIASGNQGLKDQIMALLWIQENIRMFGGDPNNVTIQGTGSTVHYLSISPQTKGLFHKIICQSCSVFNYWTIVNNPKSIAIKLCSLLGKELTEPNEIVDFLETVDPEKLVTAQEKLRVSEESFPFGASVDSKSANPLFPDHPLNLASEGVHLPILTGYTAREGLITLSDKLYFKDETREAFFKRSEENPKLLFGYNADLLLQSYNLNEMQVKRLYYKDEKISCKTLDQFVDLMSDILFVEGLHKFARVQAERSSADTYIYVFDYDSPDSMSKKMLNDAPTGACHFDDSPYIYKMKLLEEFGVDYVKKGTRGYRIMEQMTEMWANFAKFGKPTVGTTELIPVNWLPVTDGVLLRYLSIDEELLMKSMTNVEQKFLSAKSINV